MTSRLNLHAVFAIERTSVALRDVVVNYWSGLTGTDTVEDPLKGLRAQSRATRTIAPLEADAVLGTAALVEILVASAERAREDNDIHRSDELVRGAIDAIDGLRDALGTRQK